MKIGILQTGHAPDAVLGDLGDYDEMFVRLLDGHGFAFEAWPVVDGIFPDGPEAADGWLITGSRHGAYEDHPWIPPLEQLIRDIRDSGRPLIGVCFGHQIIAQALGGKVEKFPGGWAVGPQTYRMEDGSEMVINAWHQDQVTVLPPEAQVIASNEFCANAGLAIGDTILTIQPHPEFSAAMLAALLEHRAAVVPEADRKAAEAALDTPLDSAAYADRMAAFFSKGAK